MDLISVRMSVCELYTMKKDFTKFVNFKLYSSLECAYSTTSAVPALHFVKIPKYAMIFKS